MNTKEFKKLIKVAVKEAIKEELTDILLEAMNTNANVLKENTDRTLTFNSNSIPRTSQPMAQQDIRASYMQMLSETTPLTHMDKGTFIPPADPVNGNLGTGEVPMDMIMGLMNMK